MPLITDSNILDIIGRFELRGYGDRLDEKDRSGKSSLDHFTLRDKLAHSTSIAIAIEKFSEKRDSYLEFEKEMGEETVNMNQSIGLIIYGLGGSHRYYVLASGEVVFSSHHASDEACIAAEIAGFTIWR